MSYISGRSNRTILALLGVILMLLGGYGVVAAWDLPLPGAEGLRDRIVPDADASVEALLGAHDAVREALPWVATVAGVLLILGGLAWLSVQVPRAHGTRTFRPEVGVDVSVENGERASQMTVVTLNQDVLARAVQERLEEFDAVSSASVVVRGSSAEREVQAQITIPATADYRWLIAAVHERIAQDLGRALGAQEQQRCELVVRFSGSANTTTSTLVLE